MGRERPRWRCALSGLLAVLSIAGCRRADLAAPLASRPAATTAGDENPIKIPEHLVDRPLYTFTDTDLDAYLKALHGTEPDLTRRIVHLGRKNIAQPYEIYLLGEFPFELHDPDPIYRLDRSDCVTFCEHTLAMALSRDWWSFLEALQRLRYRDGVIGMLTRNHHTIADWDRNNGFLFEDLTAKLDEGRAAVPLTQLCRRASFFAKFGIGQDIPDEPIRDTYIPKERVEGIQDELRDGDFVNIIRGDEQSQWAGHTGLIAHGTDGVVNLLHSARPAVGEESLTGYLERDKRSLGIKILRLRPDAERIMGEAAASSDRATAVDAESLKEALDTLRWSAPATARPQNLDWARAMRLQGYRLDFETPEDAALKSALEEIDRRIGGQLGIPDDRRAVGVLDLTDLRLAMVRPDSMFYAASVPKICILLAYFETHPEAATNISAEVQDELGRMIKISDNQLAAKYGQLIGIEKIQEILQSGGYGFYDARHGGGLWYGKHYGKEGPRIGDPVHDHSHGATVRQCLRFYLMMEQGRLVSAAACRKMKEIFAAPALELEDAKFVAGLQGRDLTLIRKSGTWEDWYVDTARVQHGDRAYVLAAMTEHPKGEEYLAAVAGAIDEYLCGPQDRKGTEHQLILAEAPDDFRRGTIDRGRLVMDPPGVLLSCAPPVDEDGEAIVAVYESPVIETDRVFNEALVSWNAAGPPSVGYCVEARVGRRRDDSWSPYLYIADWGAAVPQTERLVECPEGSIDVDYFTSDERFDRLQYRISAASEALPDGGGDQIANLRIGRVAVVLSDMTGRITSVPRSDRRASPPKHEWQRRLAVPYRSQGVERAELAGRICSPTSIAMMLAYRGINRPTEEVAFRVFDAAHDIYGNWPRAVQTAFSYGVPGYLARFSDWTQVQRMIAADQPLIISIRADEGQLAGAPYESTDGHLLVLTGFDGEGGVWVNDPAADALSTGRTSYKRRDLETVWMKARGGTAYVLLSPSPIGPRAAEANPSDEPLVDLAEVDPRIVVDLRYATKNNFTGRQIYSSAKCQIRESVGWRLGRVQDGLVRQGLGLKVYDAYRPLSAQGVLWEIMPDPAYVADPAKGSRHNRGAAVDVTLVDAAGRELEMPTGYDDFTAAAHRDYKGGNDISRRNREILIEAMEAENFEVLATEWWHFDAPDWERYPVE